MVKRNRKKVTGLNENLKNRIDDAISNPPGARNEDPVVLAGKRIKITKEEYIRLKDAEMIEIGISGKVGINRTRYLDAEKELMKRRAGARIQVSMIKEEMKKKYKIIGAVAGFDEKTLELIIQ